MADLIAINGNIQTQNPQRPRAEALAVCGGRISAVGDTAEIRAMARPGTQVIDLKGRLTLPGFTESHIHFYDWSVGRKWPEISAVRSLGELLSVVRAAAGDPAKREVSGGWIIGQGWNESGWPEGRMPNRDDLDRVAGQRPVILWRSDLHLAVASSRALSLAGITAQTPDPDQGVICRDKTGRPTGILQDLAINRVKAEIPAVTEAEAMSAMTDAMSALHALGITGIHDLRLMDGTEGPPCFRALQRLNAENRLRLRVWTCIPGHLMDDAIRLGLRTGMGDDMLRIGHVKLFSDGGLGAHTAWMSEPFADGSCGIPLRPMSDIADMLRRAEGAGLAVAVHAIGDRANRELIRVFEQLERERPESAHHTRSRVPHRMEHLQLMQTEDIERLARLDIVGSVQPRQATDDIILTDRELGERGRLAYRFRDMLTHGIPLTFGSDCPVTAPDPLSGIHAAVTRQREDGTPEGGWYPEQRIRVAQAIHGYTVGPAKATGQWADAGSLTPGKLADFVVTDRDIRTADPGEIPETRVVLTVLGGNVVYEG
ncbi:amidohydrolase [Desulfonema ishimotonii]|uniref:Amidohydrolase n=1 Tax=Desulfonema ishimotonii TaxID=45657 RepID=A0A401FW78_9BACT|nr:amidohydrolase [Desulfonema ishimotonii]GBC61225.1 amidohydrolase [Desulfonema ishimotonii]